jgi:hypothetical protein
LNATEESEGYTDFSVWWSWRASKSGTVTVSFTGQHPVLGDLNYPSFDLSVFTDAILGELVPVEWGSVEWGSGSYERQFAFEANAGTLYTLRLSGNIGFGHFSLAVAESVAPWVFLASPLPGSIYKAGEPVTLRAEVFVPEGRADHVDFETYTSGKLSVSNWPFAMLWTNPPPGDHTLTARLTDQYGTWTRSFYVPFTVTPRNDDFADRIVIPATNYSLTVTGTLSGATFEAGEIANSLLGSAWWTWTAPASGLYTLDRASYGGIAIYTGSEISTLSLVTNTTDGGRLLLSAQAGTAYQIALYGSFGQDELTISPSAPPWIFFTAPTNSTIFGSSVLLAVRAGDPDGTVERVEFYLGGDFVETMTAPIRAAYHKS